MSVQREAAIGDCGSWTGGEETAGVWRPAQADAGGDGTLSGKNNIPLLHWIKMYARTTKIIISCCRHNMRSKETNYLELPFFYNLYNNRLEDLSMKAYLGNERDYNGN